MKRASKNQKEIHSTFTSSTKLNSSYYPEWTFVTLGYCSDGVVCQFSCVLEVCIVLF